MVFTVPESINGGPNRKTNKKVRYWDDAACIAGEEEEEIFLQRSQSCVCVFVCIAGLYIYGEWMTLDVNS